MQRYITIKDQLAERERCLFVAAEKVAVSYKVTAAVSRVSGIAYSMIIRGTKELLTVPAVMNLVRRKGTGQVTSNR